MQMSIEERRELIQKSKGFATLDGERAQVYGALLDFAVVGSLESAMAVEYAWPTVKRILENGGKFHT